MAKGPHGNILLVEPVKKEQLIGLITHGASREKPNTGIVKEKGPLVSDRISIGDTVMYGVNSGTDVKIEGVEYIILREPEIYYSL